MGRVGASLQLDDDLLRNVDAIATRAGTSREDVLEDSVRRGLTDRGRPSHVLLSIADDRRLLADERTIVDWLSVDDCVDLEAGRLDLQLETPEL